jgi:uncharacterized protein with PQ loop repeat
MIEILGFFGTLLVVIAWIPQTLRTIRTKKVGIHPKFLWIYFAGSFFLTVYAISIFDFVFIILNGISTVFSFINIYYHYAYVDESRKKNL